MKFTGMFCSICFVTCIIYVCYIHYVAHGPVGLLRIKLSIYLYLFFCCCCFVFFCFFLFWFLGFFFIYLFIYLFIFFFLNKLSIRKKFIICKVERLIVKRHRS